MDIIKCKFFQNGARYSDINPKNIDDDLYNYHLQQLVVKGFLAKKSQLYSLTEKGKSIVTNIDEETKNINATFKVGVYLCLVNGEKILMHKRLKHPQYGYFAKLNDLPKQPHRRLLIFQITH